MTTYTLDDLKQLAKWTLADTYCGAGDHKVTLTSYELFITAAPRSTVGLHVIGQCRKHNYRVHKNCAI